jgi:energy-coupling factor transporter ATP-binding protein EcfA2
MPQHNELLRNLDFGKVDAESEEELVERFVKTHGFEQISDKHTLVILGPKGSGKSAIFRLFTEYSEEAREILADEYPSNTYIVKATGGNDVRSIDDRDLQELRKQDDFSNEEFWRIYIGLQVASKLGEKGHTSGRKVGSGDELSYVLRAFNEQSDWRILPAFKSLWEAVVGNPPSSGSISYGQFSLEIGNNENMNIDRLLEKEQAILEDNDKVIWLLFDRIDELHSKDPQKRKELLEALFRVQRTFVDRFSNIRLKIFLRTDIWSELQFVNKSHIADKMIRLNWDDVQLLKLVNKRMIQNDDVLEYVEEDTSRSINPEGIEDYEKDIQQEIFYSVFEDQVYTGSREADLFDWMISRIEDGQGGRYPRELITFCNEAVLKERQSEGHPEDRLIGGLSVRDAYFVVSDKRVDTYLSEFPELEEHFGRFDGNDTAEYKYSELHDMFDDLDPNGKKAIDRMVDVGFFEEKMGEEEREYEIPRLYREGIGLVIRGRP